MAVETRIEIAVSPKSSQSRIVVDDNEEIKVYLNSPPVDGKANSECVKILSKKLKISKSSIVIEKGEKSRRKTISISGLSREDVLRILKG